MINNRKLMYPDCSSLEKDIRILTDFIDGSFDFDLSSYDKLGETLDNLSPIMEACDRVQTYCILNKVIRDNDNIDYTWYLDKVNSEFHKFEDMLIEINSLEDWADKPSLMKYGRYFDRIFIRRNRSGDAPTVSRLLEAKRDIINDMKSPDNTVSDLVESYKLSISTDELLAAEMGFPASYEAVTYRDGFSDSFIDTSLLKYPLAFPNIDLERCLSKNEISISLDDSLEIIRKVTSDISSNLIGYLDKVIDPDYIDIDNTFELGYRSKSFSINAYTFRPVTFVNYDGSFSSIGDLAHEIGHGIFSLCQKDYNDIYSFSKSPLESETAALIFELKVYDFLEKYVKDYYRSHDNFNDILRNLSASRLKVIRDTFYNDLFLISFEKKCHEDYEITKNLIESNVISYCLNYFYKYLNRRDVDIKRVLSNIEIYKSFYSFNYVLGFLFAYRMRNINKDVLRFFKKGFYGIPLFKQSVSHELHSIIHDLEYDVSSNLNRFLVQF